jgi:5'-3' exonuclease
MAMEYTGTGFPLVGDNSGPDQGIAPHIASTHTVSKYDPSSLDKTVKSSYISGMKYLLVDTSNMFFRSRHVASRGADAWTKVGTALHITLASLQKTYRLMKPDHVIFALEARSWRKDHTASYKANRAETRAAMTAAQQEEDQMFWQTYDEMHKWLDEKTNCSVIRIESAEADDIIARWTALHPDDEHVIVSTDSDFYQLLAPNVKIYNGMTNQIITVDGVFDEKMKPVRDTKTKENKVLGDPQFILFEKIMRGDSTDNVMSAYPGVRTKGTAKKVGLVEAYADRDKKGFAWNNMMLQRWVDHNGVEHRVLDRYEANRTLIDLTAQPDEIKSRIDAELLAVKPKSKPMVGAHFMKFCGKYDLVRLGESAQMMGEILGKALPKEATQ